MKLNHRTRFCRRQKCVLLLLLISCGCRSGGTSQSSSTPSTIKSSADVVKAQAANISIPAGGNADATVTLTISPGYHINANPATFPYLIATEVKRVHDPDGPCVLGEEAVYPQPIRKTFVFAAQALAVYERDITVKLPLRVPRPQERDCYIYPASGAHILLPIEVVVQACDNEKCYPPATLNATIKVDVK